MEEHKEKKTPGKACTHNTVYVKQLHFKKKKKKKEL